MREKNLLVCWNNENRKILTTELFFNILSAYKLAITDEKR